MRNVLQPLLFPLVFGFALACGDGGDGRDNFSSNVVAAAQFVTESPDAILIGDSITAMDGYVEMVQEELSAERVWRSGRAGYTTRHWIPGWGYYRRHEFEKLKPRIVVVLLGSNDASIFYRISVEEFIDNLHTITDKLLEDGVETVLLMTAPKLFERRGVVDPLPPPAVLDRLEQYAYALTWFCAPPDDGIECGPDLYTMLEEADFADGLHPNSNGHRKIADALIPYLVEPE